MRRSVSSPPPLSPAQLLAAFGPVRRAARDLADVEEGSSYGTPALRVRGRLFARLREDGDSLVLRVDFDSRDAMLQSQPRIFYITDHYRDYPAVLVRLSAVRILQLRELLADSWCYMAPKARLAKRSAAPQQAVGKPKERSAGRPRRA